MLLFANFSIVQAGPPGGAGGTFSHISSLASIRFSGNNFFLNINDSANWTGTFEGTSTLEGKVAIFGKSGAAHLNGVYAFVGTVDGKSGTLRLLIRGWYDPVNEWSGKWVIIGGTGELANLKGEGKFWGPDNGFDAIAPFDYSGNVHFEP